jgi:hypothetical protein
MKSRFYFLMALLSVFLFLTPVAFADVIEPGQKVITYDYKLTNIDNFPDFVFILHGSPNPSLEILNSSVFNFYKLSTCSIYAVPKTVFNNVQIDKMNESQVEEFLNNDSRVARSNLELDGIYKTVSSNDPLNSALVLLEIKSINDTHLYIQKTRVIYGYSDGKNDEKTFIVQNETPEHSDNGSAPVNYIYYLLLPILAIIIVSAYIIHRKRSK